MNEDTRAYLGPFVQCGYDVVEKQVAAMWECGGGHRKVHAGGGDFCPQCGNSWKQTGTRPVTEPSVKFQQVKDLSLVAHYGTRLIEGFHCYIDNTARRHGLREFELSSPFFWVDDADQDLIANETAEFVKQFKHQIAALIQAYGEGRVTTRWGLLVWEQ